MAKAQKNQEPENRVDPMSDFERQILEQIQDWERVETGFPPYFKMELGKCLVAKVCVCDARDENFVRYVMQATRVPITCQRGPVDGAEEVVVQPGEFFTISAYAGMDMDSYYDMEVFIKCAESRKLAGNEASNGKPRTLYDFDVRCSKDDHAKLKARKREEMALLIQRRTLGGAELTTAQA